MARFDVYANPDAAERRVTPYFLDVQNDFIDGLATRVVIPLRRAKAFGPRAERLHPLVQVADEPLVLDTAALGAVPSAELRRPVERLSDARAQVQEALDALFGAY
jgi:toxin CcdB